MIVILEDLLQFLKRWLVTTKVLEKGNSIIGSVRRDHDLIITKDSKSLGVNTDELIVGSLHLVFIERLWESFVFTIYLKLSLKSKAFFLFFLSLSVVTMS